MFHVSVHLLFHIISLYQAKCPGCSKQWMCTDDKISVATDGSVTAKDICKDCNRTTRGHSSSNGASANTRRSSRPTSTPLSELVTVDVGTFSTSTSGSHRPHKCKFLDETKSHSVYKHASVAENGLAALAPLEQVASRINGETRHIEYLAGIDLTLPAVDGAMKLLFPMKIIKQDKRSKESLHVDVMVGLIAQSRKGLYPIYLNDTGDKLELGTHVVKSSFSTILTEATGLENTEIVFSNHFTDNEISLMGVALDVTYPDTKAMALESKVGELEIALKSEKDKHAAQKNENKKLKKSVDDKDAEIVRLTEQLATMTDQLKKAQDKINAAKAEEGKNKGSKQSTSKRARSQNDETSEMEVTPPQKKPKGAKQKVGDLLSSPINISPTNHNLIFIL